MGGATRLLKGVVVMKASYKVHEAPWASDYVCTFFVDNRVNYDVRGSDGTGRKIYGNKKKAIDAGKRYLKKMKENGFEV